MTQAPFARLAVAALLLRLVLFAWHVHPEVVVGQGSPVWTTANPSLPGPGDRDGPLHESDLCQTLHHSGAWGAPETLALALPPVTAPTLVAASRTAPARSLSLAFRSRAPPLA
jgi:hypothetical protein